MKSLRVGVSGHQFLRKRLLDQGVTHSEGDAWDWVEDSFRAYLTSQNLPYTVVSSLAIGADQRLSKIALQLGGAIDVVIPALGLIETFPTEQDRTRFKDLLSDASTVETLRNSTPSEEAYYEAGRWTVDHSDTMVVVWDGKDADGLGGTGDVVAYAIENRKDVLQLDPIQRVVAHLSKGV